MLPPGDYPLTFDDLRRSFLVIGPPGRSDRDEAWRGQLVANLEYLARQLWQVGVVEIDLGGSFVGNRSRVQSGCPEYKDDRESPKKGDSAARDDLLSEQDIAHGGRGNPRIQRVQ